MTSKMHYKWFKKGPCHITLERRDTSLFTRDSSEPTKQYLGLEQYLNGLVKTFLSFSFKHHGVSNGVDLKWITMIKNRSYVNTENQENFLWITKLEGAICLFPVDFSLSNLKGLYFVCYLLFPKK